MTEKQMQYFEVNLSNSASGWHWTLATERGGKMTIIAESIEALPTLVDAAAEAEAEIAEPGRTWRLHSGKPRMG